MFGYGEDEDFAAVEEATLNWLWGENLEPFCACVLEGRRDEAVALASAMIDGESAEDIALYVDALIQRTSRRPEDGASASAEEIERETNWRPGDDSVLEDIRAGNTRYAILRLSLERLGVQDAETLVAAWATKAQAPEIDWAEIPKADFARKVEETTSQKEGPVYVVRYRDVVFTSQAWRCRDSGSLEFMDRNDRTRELSEVDQIWFSEPKPAGRGPR